MRDSDDRQGKKDGQRMMGVENADGRHRREREAMRVENCWKAHKKGSERMLGRKKEAQRSNSFPGFGVNISINKAFNQKQKK